MSKCSEDHDNYEKNFRFLHYFDDGEGMLGYCANCELDMMRVAETGHLAHGKWDIHRPEFKEAVAKDKRRRKT